MLFIYRNNSLFEKEVSASFFEKKEAKKLLLNVGVGPGGATACGLPTRHGRVKRGHDVLGGRGPKSTYAEKLLTIGGLGFNGASARRSKGFLLLFFKKEVLLPSTDSACKSWMPAFAGMTWRGSGACVAVAAVFAGVTGGAVQSLSLSVSVR
jgi:hypothetical protein